MLRCILPILLLLYGVQAGAAPRPSCAVLGDSLAVGVGAASGCRTWARLGISSGAYVVSMLRATEADLIVVSLGANDGANPATTADNLRAVRLVLRGRVVWLLPARPAAAREAIRAVASEWNDGVLDTAPWATGRDHLHPSRAGYRAIAAELR